MSLSLSMSVRQLITCAQGRQSSLQLFRLSPPLWMAHAAKLQRHIAAAAKGIDSRDCKRDNFAKTTVKRAIAVPPATYERMTALRESDSDAWYAEMVKIVSAKLFPGKGEGCKKTQYTHKYTNQLSHITSGHIYLRADEGIKCLALEGEKDNKDGGEGLRSLSKTARMKATKAESKHMSAADHKKMRKKLQKM